MTRLSPSRIRAVAGLLAVAALPLLVAASRPAGPNHAYIPEELIEEGKNRPQLPDLAHFADSFGAGKARANVNGNWMYYSDKVTKELDRDLAGQ